MITDYQVIDHGVEHEQYFQGCGVCFTKYKNAVTGCGDSFAEAIEDALESMAQDDISVEHIESEIKQDYADTYQVNTSVSDRGYSEDCHYYVSIRYNKN